jgi:hypothetical protein
MIMQFNTIPSEVSLEHFGYASVNRFFHDHFMSIENTEQPYIHGDMGGKDRSYILHFKLSETTRAEKITIRGLNCVFKDIKPNFFILSNYDVEIDVKKYIDRDIFILFDCNKAYNKWKLIFGEGRSGEPNSHKVTEWDYCRAVFDYFAIIKVSKPDNDETIELPRFIMSPKYSYEFINTAMRGSVGQPYGRNIRKLKTLEVQFTRVKTYLIDEYIDRAGLAIPHFIVPYPGNVFNIPPFWGTLSEVPKFTKRGENDWYWNLQMNWKEAY